MNSTPYSVVMQSALLPVKTGWLSPQSASGVYQIEAAFGLMFEPGLVPADRFWLDQEQGAVLSHDLNRQAWRITPTATGLTHQDVATIYQSTPKLTPAEIKVLYQSAKELTNQFGPSWRAHWLIDREGKLWLLDLKPDSPQPLEKDQTKPLLRGRPASAGFAAGPVRVLHSLRQLEALEDGDVLVAEVASPSLEAACQRAAALIVDTGQLTDELVVAAARSGIPAVIATGQASHRLKDGLMVSVDGTGGAVYQGKVEPPSSSHRHPPTAGTKIYTLLDRLADTEALSRLPVDGVGPVSTKLLLANPSSQTVDQLTNQLWLISEAFQPRPVIYQPTDRSSPLAEPASFTLTLEALRRLGHHERVGTVGLALAANSLQELQALSHLIVGRGLRPGPDLRVWLLCKTPATVLLMNKFAESEHIQGVILDTDQLSKLTLDQEEPSPGALPAEAVLMSLLHVIEVCRVNHLPVLASGQLLNRASMTEQLVRAGITGLIMPSGQTDEWRRLVTSIAYHQYPYEDYA